MVGCAEVLKTVVVGAAARVLAVAKATAVAKAAAVAKVLAVALVMAAVARATAAVSRVLAVAKATAAVAKATAAVARVPGEARGTGKGASKGAGKGGRGYGRAYLTDTECYIATGETMVGNYVGDTAPEQEYSVESGTDVSAYVAEDESEWYDHGCPENGNAEAESAWYAENDAQPEWHEEYASLMVSDNAVVNTNDTGSFVSVDITRSADKEVGDADAVSVKTHSITMGVLTIANDSDLTCPWYVSVQSAFLANADEEGFMKGTMDSGCTTSPTNNVEMLTNLRPCDIKIKLGDSRYTTATQRGDIAMVMKDATGAEEHFMHPALLVKECPVTLLSVSAFTKQGYDFHFGRNHACMTEEKVRPGMKSRSFPVESNGRLWELSFKL
jgi:hypothetical protein